MTKKSAIQKIEAHEKLCRIMQKQTFEQIKELKDKINRLEKILLGTAAFIIVSLIEKVI
jgi:protein-arginine kinase activator protein McsA